MGGKVSSVKDQGQCGSCAAFAAMGAIEACSAINSVMADDLSEQHILDCAYGHEFIDAGYVWGADGCDGAWPETYLDWLRSEDTYNQEESAYSYTSGYTGDVTRCNPSSSGYNNNFLLNSSSFCSLSTAILMVDLRFLSSSSMVTSLLRQVFSTTLTALRIWSAFLEVMASLVTVLQRVSAAFLSSSSINMILRVRAATSASTSLYCLSASSRDSEALVSLSLVSSYPISRFWTFLPRSLISQSAWSALAVASLVASSKKQWWHRAAQSQPSKTASSF